MSVTFGSQGMAGAFGMGMYQNTGMDFFSLGMGQAMAFFDVPDSDGLLRALDQSNSWLGAKGWRAPSDLGAGLR